MKKLKLLFLIVGVVLSFGLFACKKGDTGPTGPGSTITSYTGTFAADPTTASVPALTSNSFVEVRISTDSVNWKQAVIFNYDYTAKSITFGDWVTLVGGDYRIVVQNPS